jgi:23S rRNA (uracil1939-C5)-methyltransferase
MTVKRGQTYEVDIADVAFGGRGLVRIDGMAVFVDQAVPGDRALIRVFKRKKQFAEARAIEILTPSPDRIEAPCPYSGTCGGCKWQYLKYDRQLIYKHRHVADSLAHIGGMTDVAVHPTLPSPLVFGYRNKMEFTCSTRRWLLPSELGNPDIERGISVGLHVPGTFDKVLDTSVCLLQPELGNHILEDVRQYIKSSRQPVYGLRTHEGFWRFAVLRHSVHRDAWLVNLVTAFEDPDSIRPLAQRLSTRYPEVSGVVNNITARKAGVAVGETEIPFSGQSHLVDRIGKFDFVISANSFFQTNTRGAGQLYETVERFAGLTGSETVVDLYSGTGTIPIYLSEKAGSVTGIEIVESAVADAEINCRRNSITNCRFLRGDIRARLKDIAQAPDVLIVDPPRAGMHKDIVPQVLALNPARIVYVSCNPATLARDLALMRESYRVIEVQPVDMFPHTYHIEAVARLERR